MRALVVDLETTVTDIGGKKDNTPFNPSNKLVSAHFAWLGTREVTHLVFHHNEKPVPDSKEPLEKALQEADVLIAHNAKFDVGWLHACGFTIPPKIRCTMINEYILAKGQRTELSLKRVAEGRNEQHGNQ